MNALTKALIPLAVLVVIALALLNSMFVVVEAGHVGVVKRLGAVQPEPLGEGLHFKRPFVDQVDQIDMRLLYINAKATAASKDLQTVSAEVNVAFSLNGPLAPLVYQRIGSTAQVAAALVEPAIQESVKAVTAQYTAEELVTKRAVVKQTIQQAITTFIDTTLQEKGIGNAVQLANVAITDFAFSEEFNRAIEAKVKAEQEALRAKNEKIMRVTQAEASAAERQLAADAEAYSTEVQSKARADAIKREAEALRSSPEIIQLRSVEKWDGVLPRIQGSGVLPFLNLGGLNEPDAKPAGN
jgi:regulator of protease activity HflC (stomatin/prohibitin superfamily)